MFHFGTITPMTWWINGHWRTDQGKVGTYPPESAFVEKALKKNSSGS